MKSIHRSLTRRLSISISLIVILVLVAADIAVDSWIENQFNASVRDKTGMLMTLVNEDVEELEFDFAGEYLPEFEGSSEPEYFQLWYDGEVFERSDTLSLYSVKDLPRTNVGLNETSMEDITLPDGRSGRIVYTSFIPQVDGDDRDAFAAFVNATGYQQKPIQLAYATSRENINYYLWFIDLSFALAIIIVPLLIRFTVKNTVLYVLTPMEDLNRDIKKITFSGERAKLQVKEPVKELAPVIDSLNHFIEENYTLFMREKRLTSDIAHELKTPVTELINLAEVAIKFPGNEEVERGFKPEVLAIAARMKNIISSLMLLHKFSHQSLERNDDINLGALLHTIVEKLGEKRISLISEPEAGLTVAGNAFALESIVTNLLTNALQHSPCDTDITIILKRVSENTIRFSVRNKIENEISKDEVDAMFEPLWQKDQSRTSIENFGLGLSIAKALATATDCELYAEIHNLTIEFHLIIKT